MVDNFTFTNNGASATHTFTIASGKTLQVAPGGVMKVAAPVTAYHINQTTNFTGLGTLQLGSSSSNKASELNIGVQKPAEAGYFPIGNVNVGTALDLNVTTMNVGIANSQNAAAIGTLTATGTVTGSITTANVGYTFSYNATKTYGTGTVDFSAPTATVNNLAFGTLTIGDMPSATAYWGSQGTVRLGKGTSSASTLVVGTIDLPFGGATPSSGLLVLKGNTMAVNGSVSILGEKFTTGVGSTGEIQTRVEGTSAGLALTSGATLSLTNHLTNATSLTGNDAKLTIFFDNDPTTVIGQSIYYGFSWAGNHLSALQALNNSGIDGFANTIDDRLIWNVSGLSLANQSRVGIFYNNLDNTTYVGWIPEPSSLSVLALGGLLATRRKR